MTGKTHHVGGTAAALIAFEVMRAKGWLLPDCNEFVQLLIMYPFASFGSVFSDLDHGPDSIPSRDPIAMGINKVMRLTGAKHRSWQTHSVTVTGGFCLLLFLLVFLGNTYFSALGAVDWILLRLAVIGFVVGVVSHLILDFLTPQGIHIWPGFKVRLVPKVSFFATGGTWEKIVFWILMLFVVLLGIKIFILDIVRGFGLEKIILENEILKNLLSFSL